MTGSESNNSEKTAGSPRGISVSRDLFAGSYKTLDRVCVIGLDGVPYSLLNRLADEGFMPNVARLREQAGLHQMRVSIPEISAVSWTSFATGTHPGVHGIYGFVDLKENSYHYLFPNFRDCRAATIWDKVGAAGALSVVINQPFTYPARSLKGALVSGFVALDLQKATWPQQLLQPLKDINYQIDIDTVECRNDAERLFDELNATLQSRIRAAELLWQSDWSYFELVITGTDRLFHFLWDAVEDNNHEYYSSAMEYFGEIDRLIGRLWIQFAEQEHNGNQALERFFLLSDHGFCRINKEVYLNRWLMKEGYLRFSDPQPHNLENIDSSSKAFCIDPGRIYINQQGKFPRGSVPAESVEKLSEEISSKLGNLMCEDQVVIRKVFSKDDIYVGPLAAKAPDLVALSHHGFDLKGSLTSETVFGNSGLQGMHTWDDAFVLTGAEVKKPIQIWDLSGVILDKLGLDDQ